jgi:hypothetical protein
MLSSTSKKSRTEMNGVGIKIKREEKSSSLLNSSLSSEERVLFL